MRSPEGYNPEFQRGLFRLREQAADVLGEPHPAEGKEVVGYYKRSLEREIFDPLFPNKKRLKTHLARLKQELYADNPYSRPLVCASQINYAKEGVLAEAKAADFSTNQDRQIKFAVLFDIAHGMNLLADSVVGAEDRLRNPSAETMLSDVVDYHAERFGLNAVQNAKVFLGARQVLSHYAEFIERDHSGRTLIKEVTKLLKDSKSRERVTSSPLMQPCQVREFVVAGAELGKKLYNRLYPQTKNL